MSPRLLILTGDPSGDMHGAHVVHALREFGLSLWEIAAVGGVRLKECGVRMISDQSKMARVGLGAIFGAPYHYFLGRRILKFAEAFRPDAVLLIDYGGFNLLMAQQFKQRGFRVFYYIPPQVWATRRGRIQRIKRYVDHIFCIFPFEETLYRDHGIPVTYVGHPLASQLPPPVSKADFCARYGLNSDLPLIALLPGSRPVELHYVLKPMLQSLPMICAQAPKTHHGTLQGPIQFVLSKAHSLSAEKFTRAYGEASAGIRDLPEITVLDGKSHEMQSAADVAIVSSGTATLETALYGTPMVIVYKLHPLIGELAMRIKYLPYIGLPNILGGTDTCIIPEVLQGALTPENITAAILPYFQASSPETQAAHRLFQSIRDSMAEKYSAGEVALKIREFVVPETLLLGHAVKDENVQDVSTILS